MSFMQLLGGFLLILLGLLTLAIVVFRARTAKGVPQHPDWKPIVGILPELIANKERIFDWLVESHHQIGRSFQVSAIGPISFTSISVHPSPENLQHILKDRFENYNVSSLRKLNVGELFGHGIFTSDGKNWHQQRKAGSLLFTGRELRGKMTEVFLRRARDFLRHLDAQTAVAAPGPATVDLHELFFRWTMDCFAEVAFSYETRALDAALEGQGDEFGDAFDVVQSGIADRFFKPWWKLEQLVRWPWGSEPGIGRGLRTLNTVVERVVEDRLAHEQEEMDRDSSEADLITHFLRIGRRQNMPLDKRSLRDIVVNFMVAGRDTTACALSHFMYELAKHPQVARKLRAEIRVVLGAAQEKSADPATTAAEGSSAAAAADQDSTGRAGSSMSSSSRAQYQHVQHPEDTELGIITPDYATAAQLTYTEACLRETLRLHPSLPYADKQAVEEDVLPDGTPVPAGSLVAYSPYLFGRWEDNWGPDVLEFKPERWLAEDGSLIQHSQFKFPTFNAGPRVCLGQGLALLEMKLMVAMLFQRFRFSLAPETNAQYRITITLQMLHGLKLHVLPLGRPGEDGAEHVDSDFELLGEEAEAAAKPEPQEGLRQRPVALKQD